MKLKIILLSILLFFTAFAQIEEDAALSKGDGIKTYSFTGTLDEQDTIYTSEFYLRDCETIFYIHRHYNSITSKPRVKLLRQERLWEDQWSLSDTYTIDDSLETYQAARADTVSAGYPVASRFVIIGIAANPADTEFDIKVVAKLEG